MGGCAPPSCVVREYLFRYDGSLACKSSLTVPKLLTRGFANVTLMHFALCSRSPSLARQVLGNVFGFQADSVLNQRDNAISMLASRLSR